jgi:hypothetical protein
VLITGDRDFTPLVQALRQHGKWVIGVGIKHTASYSLANLCDDYIYYKDILSFGQEPEIPARDLLVRVLDELFLAGTNRVPSSVVKQRMNDLSGGKFDHTLYAPGNFTQFLKEYPDLIEIYHEDSTTYVCRPQTSPDELLHEKYRTGLKKQRLRVVLPARLRIDLKRGGGF